MQTFIGNIEAKLDDKGRIFVKQSEVGKGTTFRIEMKK